MTAPVITDVKIGRIQHGGTGIYGYPVIVTYSDDTTHRTGFVSSSYSDESGTWVSVGDVFIDKVVRERCGGKLTPAFIRKFYSDKES